MRAIVLAVLLAASFSSAQEPEAIDWARNKAIPLDTVEARNGFTDVQRLRDVVGGARIVSLGEATHDSREFFQLKHRMLEFLATEMGFDIFSLKPTCPKRTG